MAFQGTLSGGKLVLPKDVASIQVSSISQATFKSLSLNSYDFDHPRGNTMKSVNYKLGTWLGFEIMGAECYWNFFTSLKKKLYSNT